MVNIFLWLYLSVVVKKKVFGLGTNTAVFSCALLMMDASDGNVMVAELSQGPVILTFRLKGSPGSYKPFAVKILNCRT